MPGILGQQRRQLADRLQRFGARDRHAVAPEAGHEPDAVLRVAAVRRRGGPSAATAEVAERVEARGRLRVDRLRRGGRRRVHGLQQLPAKRLEPRLVLAGAVVALAGVRLQVVELRARRLDQLVARRPPGVKRRPAVLQLRVQRLGIGRQVFERFARGGAAARSVPPCPSPRGPRSRAASAPRRCRGPRSSARVRQGHPGRP